MSGVLLLTHMLVCGLLPPSLECRFQESLHFNRSWSPLYPILYCSTCHSVGFNKHPVNEWRSTGCVAVEPQQGMVNDKILMLPKSQIWGIPGRVATYSFKNWWGMNTLKTEQNKTNKQKSNQNKSHSGNQSSVKWKISFKRQTIRYHTKVKAFQIVGCCVHQEMNYDGLCSKSISSRCYAVMKVSKILEIIRKWVEKGNRFCLCTVPCYACAYSPKDGFSCYISKVT